MPLAAPIALLLTTATARSKALWVGGVDMTKDSATGVGVPLESVEVEEVGLLGTSSMTFHIDVPVSGVPPSVKIADGMDVRFWDLTNDVPIFVGWVQQWTTIPDFGTVGYTLEVTAIGPEALLDWSYCPAITFAAGTIIQDAVLAAVGQAYGTGPLRALGGTSSTQNTPVGGGPAGVSGASLDAALTTTAGTLRETLRQICKAPMHNVGGGGGVVTMGFLVDMYYGLRISQDVGNGIGPNDWTTLTIDDTTGAPFTEALKHDTDAAGIVHAVFVTGGNAAGTGIVSDGSGKIGSVAQLSDSSITTADAKQAAGLAYLAQFSIGTRGSFMLQDWTPTLTVHAGGQLILFNEPRLPSVGGSYVIASIRKTFQATRQNWTISYGGLQPSAMGTTRRLTRSTLS